MSYISVEEAKQRGGVRVVVTRGIPVPWSEAVKGLLHVKKIEHARVAHEPARPNPEIEAWTGSHNAPVLLVDDEEPIDRWAQILVRLEQLKPLPKLIPVDQEDRMLMLGMIHELMDVDGYIWNRRLWLIEQPESVNKTLPPEAIELLRSKYYVLTTGQPIKRIITILQAFAERLKRQKALGSKYFIGDRLTALDIYWAAACGLASPMEQTRCPIPDPGVRFNYTERVPEIIAATDPILYEHRDYIYETYLELPIRL